MKNVIFFILIFIILSCNCGQVRKDNIDNYLKIGSKFNVNKEYFIDNYGYYKPELYKSNDSILIYTVGNFNIKIDQYTHQIQEVNNIK